MNQPTFTHKQVTSLAKWPSEQDRVLFILLAATGVRISEGLGVEIDKHISADFLTLEIEQIVRNGKIEPRVKTEYSEREG